MLQFAAVILSAALMWAAFPPLNLGFVIFVAPVPLLWALRRVRGIREASWLGFTFGVAFFGGMLWWIFILGAVAWVPLTVVMALYALLYGLLLFLVRMWSPWRWWAMAVGGWAAWEFLRARFPLNGFPWGSAGYPVGTIPWMRGSAQWIGPTGWAVLVVAFAAALVLMTEEPRDRRPLEATLAVILALTVLGAIFGPDAGGREVNVAIVQGNSPCPRVHCDNEKQRVYNAHLALTRSITPGSADLVLWPEDSFGGDFNPTTNPEVRSQMAGEAVRIGAYLLAGGTRGVDVEHFENLNILFAPDGTVAGEYLKQHPVPFGEYIPMRGLMEDLISQLDAVPRDMVRGTGPVVFDLFDGEVSLGTVISFEGAFIRTMRAHARAGADLMLVATNEASYGRGPASDQLIGMVRMNAAALGLDVAHGAVTGRSAFITAGGSIGETTGLFTETVHRGAVNVQGSGRTLYTLTGDWLQLLAILGAVSVLIAGYREPREFRIRPGVRR